MHYILLFIMGMHGLLYGMNQSMSEDYKTYVKDTIEPHIQYSHDDIIPEHIEPLIKEYILQDNATKVTNYKTIMQCFDLLEKKKDDQTIEHVFLMYKKQRPHLAALIRSGLNIGSFLYQIVEKNDLDIVNTYIKVFNPQKELLTENLTFAIYPSMAQLLLDYGAQLEHALDGETPLLEAVVSDEGYKIDLLNFYIRRINEYNIPIALDKTLFNCLKNNWLKLTMEESLFSEKIRIIRLAVTKWARKHKKDSKKHADDLNWRDVKNIYPGCVKESIPLKLGSAIKIIMKPNHPGKMMNDQYALALKNLGLESDQY